MNGGLVEHAIPKMQTDNNRQKLQLGSEFIGRVMSNISFLTFKLEKEYINIWTLHYMNPCRTCLQIV